MSTGNRYFGVVLGNVKADDIMVNLAEAIICYDFADGGGNVYR
jgi:hypothetical protein